MGAFRFFRAASLRFINFPTEKFIQLPRFHLPGFHASQLMGSLGLLSLLSLLSMWSFLVYWVC